MDIRDKIRRTPGLLIAFEGIDGSGKSSTMRRCQRSLECWLGPHTTVRTREPGGTPKAEKVRRLILAQRPSFINSSVATSMFASARDLLVHGKIKPALKKRKIVLVGRCLMSSLVYQTSNLTKSKTGSVPINLIWQANRKATDDFKVLPDLILCFTTFHRPWVMKKVTRRINRRRNTDWVDRITSSSIKQAFKLDSHYLYWAHHWKACPVYLIKASLPTWLRVKIANRIIRRRILKLRMQNGWI